MAPILLCDHNDSAVSEPASTWKITVRSATLSTTVLILLKPAFRSSSTSSDLTRASNLSANHLLPCQKPSDPFDQTGQIRALRLGSVAFSVKSIRTGVSSDTCTYIVTFKEMFEVLKWLKLGFSCKTHYVIQFIDRNYTQISKLLKSYALSYWRKWA